MSTWFFEKRDSRGVYTNPKHDEHFAFVSGIVSSLVRETIQNSGDASDPTTGKPVRVRMRFGKIDATRLRYYLPGLEQHLKYFKGLNSVFLTTKAIRFLTIEDFETHGLRGSYEPSTDGADSSYISFWHRYGESGKKNEHGGRHGLGKSTIASSSNLRLFFGASVSSDSNPRQVLLQGQICLQPHKVVDAEKNEVVYDAYGLWYNTVGYGKTIPFIDRAAAGFLHDFKLERERNPGLSLVIPYLHEDLTSENLIQEIIKNCFHQIISRQLVVEVDLVLIDAGSIKNLTTLYKIKGLDAAIALSEEAVKGKVPFTNTRGDSVATRLTEAHFDAAILAAMRKRWSDGETVAVRLPVAIREKGIATQVGEVQLYLRREQDEALARETYVRGRVSIPMRSRTGRSNCVCLLVADSGVASKFLGDSEPPAHDRWLIGRLKALYKNPDEALNRIKYALHDLLSIVDSAGDERAIKDAFTDYLWAPKSIEPEDEPRSHKNVKPKPISQPAVSKPPQSHSLDRIDGGFWYRYQSVDGVLAAASAKIVVSYRRRDTSKTSSKAKFHDFDGKMNIHETGSSCVDQQVEPRRILFQLSDVPTGYELRVTGFDQNRDIELRMEAGAE